MGSYHFWRRCLLGVGALVTLFGLLLAFFSRSGLFDIFMNSIDHIFWPQGQVPAGAEAFQMWIYGAWGATVAGFGLVLVFLAGFALRNRQTWAWEAVAASILLWYVVDTGYSVWFGVVANVILNTGLLVAVGLPLLMMRRGLPGAGGGA